MGLPFLLVQGLSCILTTGNWYVEGRAVINIKNVTF